MNKHVSRSTPKNHSKNRPPVAWRATLDKLRKLSNEVAAKAAELGPDYPLEAIASGLVMMLIAADRFEAGESKGLEVLAMWTAPGLGFRSEFNVFITDEATKREFFEKHSNKTDGAK